MIAENVVILIKLLLPRPKINPSTSSGRILNKLMGEFSLILKQVSFEGLFQTKSRSLIIDF
ncbi:hypothetical protein COS31_04860 [Candidatus Roizmanbacteria bacterium CG02_land_8_20_14_3_00_36_15]|uniref:Uncharacterized protein n=1 Tax=Candidatus Roizmanbacteria bacterium CG10_big_fil_rev_8_21_14_0_10_36_26 TaxID=1974851 RepID=A0A2M8KKC1_9BACT|nr:MAG: hypothetical protein COS31_04860 [Candidatus Roizmanbacteria bacterium CG02_land_8_20_14_3_00_36_15]PIY70571.1 MAG: hypothetical protein COY89_00915 [Candidatus Roizmanbacteria bacterium CG_4_10_14_0_8_um_filter_36_36]PJA52738.1 MAG: hypothetical protein CO166_04470 [Candidatus Roizmanbacteria bacterium CG_4_9_14_3_um_filter_36_11]PJE60369.1 MAG: hypothetical protein COU86_05045 [Candidatus Roizmanbacteria bacterium CG10_big_fil_rev_8_21_14_0_10_36_26]